MTGRLIAFEGGEAVGKSTQAKLLAEKLGALHTFEPGDTRLGKRIRKLVLDSTGRPLSPRAEALLMAADRAQHVAEVIRPALESGRHVGDRPLYRLVVGLPGFRARFGGRRCIGGISFCYCRPRLRSCCAA